MRLPDFITANVESILVEWEAYARSIWPGHAHTSPAELRDHAEMILHAVVRDMRSPQTDSERSAKSQGHGAQSNHSDHLDDASNLHGAGRVESGFQVMEVVSEYRALRASVIQLWEETKPQQDKSDLGDLKRFNEAIDQSLTRAIASVTDRADQSRRLFLAILGHDLRNPIVGIKLTAQVLPTRAQLAAEATELAQNIKKSAEAMERMVSDLIDFTASGFGGHMPITREAHANLNDICVEVVNEVRAVHPEQIINVECHGDLSCPCDLRRLRQAIGNLLNNAVEHGASGQPVTLRVRGEKKHVVVQIHNHGKPIPPALLPMLFDPLRRNASGLLPQRNRPGLGLGLFIAHQVVIAHGGKIEVTSTQSEGTTFTATLPK